MRLLVTLMLALCVFSIKAGSISEDDAVKAIAGEGENQGYKGQLLLAHALRNRGTTNGVYGVGAPRVKKQQVSQKILDDCRRAWRQSASEPDPTNGATHWENTRQFGVPYWVKSMTLAAEYKDHRFYRKKK